MRRIVESPSGSVESGMFLLGDDDGRLRLISFDGRTLRSVRMGSSIRSVAWRHPRLAHVLLENRQLCCLDPEAWSMAPAVAGPCGAMDVSHDLVVLSGRLEGGGYLWTGGELTPIAADSHPWRAVAFLENATSYAIADAAGAVEIVTPEAQIAIASTIRHGEADTRLYHDAVRRRLVVAQGPLDSAVFPQVCLRAISYDGRVLAERHAPMASPGAVCVSPRGVLFYEQQGLIDFDEGRLLSPASSYPATDLLYLAVSSPSEISLRGLRSDGSLLSLNLA